MSDAATEPRIAARQPVVVQLAAGTYFWCRCGHSQHQPFCDGSHKSTAMTPLRWDLAEDRKVALCMCKRTSSAPLCDGTHKTLAPP